MRCLTSGSAELTEPAIYILVMLPHTSQRLLQYKRGRFHRNRMGTPDSASLFPGWLVHCALRLRSLTMDLKPLRRSWEPHTMVTTIGESKTGRRLSR